MLSTEARIPPTQETTELTLPQNVQNIFRLAPDAVFESDHAYIQHVEAMETLRVMEFQVAQGIEDKVCVSYARELHCSQ
jgi:hypothetical protein